jgi:hypothetical protein
VFKSIEKKSVENCKAVKQINLGAQGLDTGTGKTNPFPDRQKKKKSLCVLFFLYLFLNNAIFFLKLARHL